MMLALVGAPLGGYLSDKWMKRRLNARLLFPALSTIITAILLFIGLTFFSGNIQYAFILVVGLTIILFLLSAAAATQDVVHPGLRAISYAWCVIFQNLLGASLGPLFIGAISDRYNIKIALGILPVFLLLASVLFLAGSFFLHARPEQG